MTGVMESSRASRLPKAASNPMIRTPALTPVNEPGRLPISRLAHPRVLSRQPSVPLRNGSRSKLVAPRANGAGHGAAVDRRPSAVNSGPTNSRLLPIRSTLTLASPRRASPIIKSPTASTASSRVPAQVLGPTKTVPAQKATGSTASLLFNKPSWLSHGQEKPALVHATSDAAYAPDPSTTILTPAQPRFASIPATMCEAEEQLKDVELSFSSEDSLGDVSFFGNATSRYARANRGPSSISGPTERPSAPHTAHVEILRVQLQGLRVESAQHAWEEVRRRAESDLEDVRAMKESIKELFDRAAA
ncbi:hypothetical protein IAU60_005744 [Kwoniella sp. DSM 27419]